MKAKVSQKGAIREALQTLGVETPAADVIKWVDDKYKLGLGKRKHSAQVVSMVRGEVRGSSGKRTVRKAKPARDSGGLELALEFVRSIGGLDAARAQLDKLEEIKRSL